MFLIKVVTHQSFLQQTEHKSLTNVQQPIRDTKLNQTIHMDFAATVAKGEYQIPKAVLK
jgi:hypothetical protein